LRALQELHEKYTVLLRERLSAELRKLPPTSFELFAKSLLEVYGFEDTHVTQVTRDGGIDGYGKLRVGLAHLNVAFQCKRWTKSNIQRTEIDKFLGASQGEYEQGIFFATTSFSPGAVGASVKRGAIPIVLIDLAQIVDLMIDKRFGVQIESLQIPTYALDLALTSPKENGKASV
jgi:restriction system protein